MTNLIEDFENCSQQQVDSVLETVNSAKTTFKHEQNKEKSSQNNLNGHKPWFNKKCKNMRNSYYAAKRMFEKTTNNINKDKMQFAKKNYKKSCQSNENSVQKAISNESQHS